MPQSVLFFVQNQTKPAQRRVNQTKPKPVLIYSNRGFVPFIRLQIRGSTSLHLRLVVCDSHRLPSLLFIAFDGLSSSREIGFDIDGRVFLISAYELKTTVAVSTCWSLWNRYEYLFV